MIAQILKYVASYTSVSQPVFSEDGQDEVHTCMTSEFISICAYDYRDHGGVQYACQYSTDW
jgi:hypothetical protein